MRAVLCDALVKDTVISNLRIGWYRRHVGIKRRFHMRCALRAIAIPSNATQRAQRIWKRRLRQVNAIAT